MAGSFPSLRDRQEFRHIPIAKITRNPAQPRKLFDMTGLEQLADSIGRYGVITPLTVRRRDGGYELIAGERRLRASKKAGLETVPCYIINASSEDSSFMALVENLQRQDLDFFEEAQSIRRLCVEYSMTQEQAAKRIGKTQSSVANKLRLLRLSPETIEFIREHRLTERHARTLLRLETEELQLKAAHIMAAKQMNVEQAEGYVEGLLKPASKKGKKQILLRDVRIFINTVEHAIGIMKKSGLSPQFEQRKEGDELVFMIRLPVEEASHLKIGS